MPAVRLPGRYPALRWNCRATWYTGEARSMNTAGAECQMPLARLPERRRPEWHRLDLYFDLCSVSYTFLSFMRGKKLGEEEVLIPQRGKGEIKQLRFQRFAKSCLSAKTRTVH